MTEESKKGLINGVREELGTEFEVFFSPIDQHNGTEQKSMTVIPRGPKTGPIFCIEINFRAIPVEETGIKGMARKIADVCRSCYDSNQGSKFFVRLDKNEILEKVEYQVINAEKNRTRLMEMPHERLLDLAAIYRMVLSEDEECKIHFAVTYSFCKMYEISGEELAAAAKQNMKSREFYLQTAEEYLSEITGLSKETFPILVPMYIINNHNGDNGADALLCNSMFESLSGKLENDLYILPASVDEIIVIPMGRHEASELRNLVKSINNHETPENMVLSDNVYRYCRNSGQMTIV